MKVKEESEEGLKFNLQKTKIMASGPITSCQTDGETMGAVTDFIFFSIDWYDLLAVQQTLKSFLQNHNVKASIFLL